MRGVTGLWRRSLSTRITVLATLTTAAVLAVVVAALLALFTRQLDSSVDQGLQARLGDLQAAVADGDVAEISRESFAALYRDGRVARSSDRLPAPGQLLAAPPACPAAPRVVRRDVQLAGRTEPVPLRVLSACQDNGDILVVAASVEAQREARDRLAVLLPLAAAALLLLVALTVGRAVRAALRPVDALTRRAAQISAGSDTGRGLPTVDGDDEIARLTGTLDEMLERLAVSFEREQAFVDDASHELRTPLAVLSGEIELALALRHDPPAVEQSLRAAQVEAARLRALTEDLLVLARERAGTPTRGHTRLAGALNATAARLAGPLSITVRVECPDQTAVELSPERIDRLLTNLLRNAAAAGCGEAAVSAVPDGAAVLVSVADDGPGFPPDYLPRALERFSRADVARGGGGTGLGLAIVATIVSDAGGTISVGNDSPLGGAQVRLRLPANTLTSVR